jgi:mannose-1-phosphate guanylyltransferase
MNIVPVLLAGGIGERFWPLSRSATPKQLLRLAGRRTMIEDTLLRVRPFCRGTIKPLIVTGRGLAARIKAGLTDAKNCDWILEPEGKNTAPAVAAAAIWVMRTYGDALMAILAADHAIAPTAQFVAAVRQAAAIAATHESLVIFGIRPSRPDTGYGYIHLGKKLAGSFSHPSFQVRRFVEKPDLKTATAYCSSGRYLWNSGMFVWKASVILEEFKRSMPELYDQAAARGRAGFKPAALQRYYGACVKESIDFGIMEKARNVVVVCGGFTWDDIGSWESIGRLFAAGEGGTTAVGRRIVHPDTRDSIIVNRSSQTVAACGLDAMIVVATADALLVVPRAKLHLLKKYLGVLKADPRLPRNLF